ncbi:16S rRNA (cytidine(1402)-2'-O)-methyltransferase [Gorillibacterium sp. sgz5001074]|uniref:16S rRNA (cytidine(1402)-2'-O)-methyltransferase n=1 Tax=Gorillibacterium sp. sgz5001074 TaxID=3446695 RepID=UPI003F670BDA
MQIQKSYADRPGSEGTLYLVATPIGNLEDMTFRAVRTLKEADIIAAEDTRQTRKLLTHFDIGGRLVSYHEHNKHASGPELVRLMKEGQTIALVSDAGLPAISDPGEDLVRLAVEEGIRVVPVPGANAALSALIASGLPTAGFRFGGFLPREKKGLKEALAPLAGDPATFLCYESPHRVAKTLEAMLDVWGNRRVVLARELTKRYEEFTRGTLEEALAYLEEHPPLGEYCLVVEGAQAGAASGAYGVADSGDWWQAKSIREHVDHYGEQGLDRKEAMKKAAQDRGVSKREIYQALLEEE